jgi:transcriptional regulator with XRE-family HTH domain
MKTDRSFGRLIKELRIDKKWNIEKFIKKLNSKVSQPYIVKVELYGEIPSPALIIKMANVLEYNRNKLWELAKKSKLNKYEKSLDRKFQQALGYSVLGK